MAVFAIVIINVAYVLPVSPESPMAQDVFARVFGPSLRLYVASLVAFVVGQMLDIAVFGFFRRLTGHRFLWLRATGSTLFSHAIDTLVVSSVFLWGLKPVWFIFTTAL